MLHWCCLNTCHTVILIKYVKWVIKINYELVSALRTNFTFLYKLHAFDQKFWPLDHILRIALLSDEINEQLVSHYLSISNLSKCMTSLCLCKFEFNKIELVKCILLCLMMRDVCSFQGPFVHVASITATLLGKMITTFRGIYEVSGPTYRHISGDICIVTGCVAGW